MLFLFSLSIICLLLLWLYCDKAVFFVYFLVHVVDCYLCESDILDSRGAWGYSLWTPWTERIPWKTHPAGKWHPVRVTCLLTLPPPPGGVPPEKLDGGVQPTYVRPKWPKNDNYLWSKWLKKYIHTQTWSFENRVSKNINSFYYLVIKIIKLVQRPIKNLNIVNNVIM